LGLTVYSLHADSQQGRQHPAIVLPLVTALVACYLPNLVLRWMASRRKREIFELSRCR
jgi:tight adherence protein C